MSEQKPSNKLRSQIYNQLSQKETDELVAIWRENDREGWTDEAFEAVEAILLERLGKLPGLEEEGELTEEVVYPTDRKLYRIAALSGTLSWAVLVVGVANALLRLLQSIGFQNLPFDLSINGIFNLLVYILSTVDNLMFTGFTFLLLQAIEEIIYVLMDIRELARLDAQES